MMILNKSEEGKKGLYQWDTGRFLTVSEGIDQVHFANQPYGRSVDRDVENGIVEIPENLLQSTNNIYAWAYVHDQEGGFTVDEKIFPVKKRNKPSDYVFTPADQTTLEEIREEVDQIKKDLPETVEQSVNDFFVAHPELFKEEDPTVSDWAKKPRKPEYTASEVGAIPNGGDADSDVSFKRVKAEELKATKEIVLLNNQAANVSLVNKSISQVGPAVAFVSEAEEGQEIPNVLLKNLAEPEDPTDAANMGYVDKLGEILSNRIDKEGVRVSGAKVGQILKVTAVDKDGLPAAYKTVEPFGEWELLADVTTVEDASAIVQDLEKPGLFSELLIIANTPSGSTGNAWYGESHAGSMWFQMGTLGNENAPSSYIKMAHVFLTETHMTAISLSAKNTASSASAYIGFQQEDFRNVSRLALYTQNNVGIYKAGTIVKMYGRRIGV